MGIGDIWFPFHCVVSASLDGKGEGGARAFWVYRAEVQVQQAARQYLHVVHSQWQAV